MGSSDPELLKRLLACYLLGLSVAFTVPLALRGGGFSVAEAIELFLVFFAGGLFASWPLALLAAILLIAFKSRILAKPFVWTGAAMTAAPIAYLLLEYCATFHTRLSLAEYAMKQLGREAELPYYVRPRAAACLARGQSIFEQRQAPNRFYDRPISRSDRPQKHAPINRWPHQTPHSSAATIQEAPSRLDG
jgi:hypothetical protein